MFQELMSNATREKSEAYNSMKNMKGPVVGFEILSRNPVTVMGQLGNIIKEPIAKATKIVVSLFQKCYFDQERNVESKLLLKQQLKDFLKMQLRIIVMQRRSK